MLSMTPSTVGTQRSGPEPGHTMAAVGYYYELVPLRSLPQVDLSVSIKSRFIRSRRALRVINFMTGSPLTFLGYMIYLTLATAAFVVPASTGRVMVVVGVTIGFLPALVSISMLRYELVVVLVETYDIWFFGGVSTLVSLLLGRLLGDARALLMVTSWILFLVNIFIDASLLNVRRFWIGNCISAGVYLMIAVGVGANVTDELHAYNVLHTNGHTLPATAIVRDGLVSMIVAILRNVSRQRDHIRAEQLSSAAAPPGRPHATKLVTCVSFQCRLQLVRVVSSMSQNTGITNHAQETAAATSSSTNIAAKMTQLRFSPFLGPLDPHNSVLSHHHWFCKNHGQRRHIAPISAWSRRRSSCTSGWLFQLIGIWSFVGPHIAITCQVSEPPLVNKSALSVVTLSSSFATFVFMGTCLANCQRQLLRAVATSFDFLFIASQVTVAILAIADLCRWKGAIVVPLVLDWLWCMWMLCWDAMLPDVRKRLGLSTRFAALIGTALVTILVVDGVFMFLIFPPHTLNERVIWQTNLWGHHIEFTALSWYFSCATNITTWSIRVIWRLWQASDNELVVLDGPVSYELPARTRVGQVRETPHAQVATLEKTMMTTTAAPSLGLHNIVPAGPSPS